MVTVGLLVFFNMELPLLRNNDKTWVCYTGIYTFLTDVLYVRAVAEVGDIGSPGPWLQTGD